ncbi:hypothetical protein BJF87_16045 [Gordonia sp. CNJ-863]|uniref:hypothetical protein n=1 Tax=Gordonia sp. CNJ-863 TaxID=1904963 RepID=UPI0009663EA7|nr:hypothetical protein [Gordonia sp. CNJ-863]OLT51227.1 hypothetical protein BJF87_16045 [Gordonia sp. CNJ-863]
MTLIQELEQIATDLEGLADGYTDVSADIAALDGAGEDVGKSWSGSNVGYQSRVYYADFRLPDSNERFSQEWGFMMRGSETPWRTYSVDEVNAEIIARSGAVDITRLEDRASKDREQVLDHKESLISILSTALSSNEDAYLKELKKKVEETFPRSKNSFARSLTPPRRIVMSRDQAAIDGGFTIAPHHNMMGLARSYKAVYDTARSLSQSAKHAAQHLGRTEPERQVMTDAQAGTRIFLGHGQSNQWREVKDGPGARIGDRVSHAA